MAVMEAHEAAQQLGERVKGARERAGLTQEELARRVRVERTAINKMERGTRKVSAVELSEIAHALGVKMTAFFEEPTPAVVAYRSAHGLAVEGTRLTGMAEKLAADVEFVQSLTDIGGMEETPWPLITSQEEAERMARQLRGLWGLQETEPALGLVGLASRIGLYAFSEELGDDVAAAAVIALKQGGVALINSSNKVGRRRLALAHEVGHYLIGDSYSVEARGISGNKTEEYLDYFARAVLLPQAAVEEQWSRWVEQHGLRGAAVLAAGTYHVDMSTLARRLSDLGVIDAQQAGAIRTEHTTKADMVEFDLYPGSELEGTTQPRAFQQAVLLLVRREQISRERALELLGGLFSTEDLPQPELKGKNAVWEYVS
ncbi:helix-turn-helix domain-containing protein [Corynebacterium lowii]|uniref:Anaerobic benzoate catabolism transcriptional regulator n=1 Tax=Corynebacterium lowii TaxID=1544413 RepID=A0A0Q0Z5N4_9CORY|nr:XRE family transcriptional regulator [Corynebacterium lowii]KQB84814.1 anaerobic benzoate catabolism transcriptional regulator [Corynebacterium lowii]MDP9851718.1 transcriptional regulator with XRE-family HTH domain [Corynebacterium lowii]